MKVLGRFFLIVLFVCIAISTADAANGGKIRLGVFDFSSKATGVTNDQAAIITDLFINALSGSEKISIVERTELEKVLDEIYIGDTGLIDPSTAAQIGNLLGAKYMLLGSLTAVTNKKDRGQVWIFNLTNETSTATIHARIVDAETSEVIKTFSEIGNAKGSGAGIITPGLVYVQDVQEEFGEFATAAIFDAVRLVAHKIRVELADEHSRVASESGSKIIIDEGTNLGVKPNDLYLVYADGESVRGSGGKLLGRQKIPLAVLKVNSAENGFSECALAPPSSKGVIARGDKVEPISAEEAKKIAPKLPKKRPAGLNRSSTLDDLLSGGAPATGQEAPAQPATPVAAPASKGEETTARPVPAVAPVIEGGAAPARPAPAAAPAPRELSFDPNQSTGWEVIKSYPIPDFEKNTLGIAHRGAYTLYSNKRYKQALEKFAELVEGYPSSNYLSAYWAGMSALKIKGARAEAAEWFDRALEINPDYQPAIDARGKL